MTRTHESLSGRFCSWKKPTACISSWIAVPFLRQSEARETFCSPPCLPILEKQLQNTKTVNTLRETHPRKIFTGATSQFSEGISKIGSLHKHHSMNVLYKVTAMGLSCKIMIFWGII